MSEYASDVRLPFGDRLGQVSPVLVAHGTRSARGLDVIAEIAEAVSRRVGTTRTAFVDVLGPTPSEVIADTDRPALLVPAFLASGYHVRKDLPEHVLASGRTDAIVTRALGPDPAIAAVARLRLIEAGWEPGDAVVLAAAGSSDESACGQVHLAARQLESLIGGRVEVGFITTARPSVPEAIEAAGRGGRRVVVASYLLAPGLFHERLSTYGADVVAAPLGADPRIVDLIVTRMRAAISPYRREAAVRLLRR
ncbi:sirohydrochlorin chelatase [Gordonia sp. ABSL1-1]|uniref:sirohydrochlorin chelatase n=1 Tax=Gordonia sp. ABSL1-1 TaxID=3053923 RepID=UPI0025730190|nr:sirohydrochlorin chelatase [Gordonia sp. ABSL1-1]MDL9936792.1 sirohydrochlorin chelatase [Gordonia sp. ABSL1-1]